MKTINFKSRIDPTINLQNLQDELGSIGVKAFIVDHEHQKISIVTGGQTDDRNLACAVAKAGYKCSCFEVCNHQDINA